MAGSKRERTYKTPSERKQEKKKRQHMSTRKKRTILIACLIIGLLTFTYVKNIVSLKIEHNRLVKEQAQLIAEIDKLKKTLEKVDDANYIEELARKQLKLMNPDEIMFTFGDEETAKDEKK